MLCYDLDIMSMKYMVNQSAMARRSQYRSAYLGGPKGFMRQIQEEAELDAQVVDEVAPEEAVNTEIAPESDRLEAGLGRVGVEAAYEHTEN